MALTAKIGLPLHGAALLLTVGVGICNYLATAQQLDVAEPLHDAAFGCPYMRSWTTSHNCQGIYRALTDSAWSAAATKMSYDGTEYTCCRAENFPAPNGPCASGSKSKDHGTCALADNYCPTLEVVKASHSACQGVYTQVDNSTWHKATSLTVGVKLVGRDAKSREGKLMFHCIHMGSGMHVATVVEFKCVNPLLPDGKLKYGLNKIKDDWIFVVGHRGPGRMIEGDAFRSFEMTTPPTGQNERVWVWPLGSNWPNKTVVIAQMFNDEPAATAVQLSDVRENTFKLRTSHATCSAKHKKERINILQIQVGKHLGLKGQTVIVSRDVVTGTTAKVRYLDGKALPGRPLVLTQVQQINSGPYHGFLTSRVLHRTTAEFEVTVQGLARSDCAKASHCSAVVGSVAIWLDGIRTGALRPHDAIVKGSKTSAKRMTNKLYREVDTACPFSRTPTVFVQAQTQHELNTVIGRLHTAAPGRQEYSLAEVESAACPVVDNATNTDLGEVAEEMGMLQVGETERHSAPEDCTLVMESPDYRDLFFVYSAQSFNGNPVFRQVMKDGTFGRYLYFASTHIWNYNYKMSSNKNEKLGYVYTTETNCPEGKFYKKTSLGVSVARGNLRKAPGAIRSMCVPSPSFVRDGKLTKVASVYDLPSCAKLVRSMNPNAVGADLEGSLCYAVEGREAHQTSEPRSGGYSCIFQGNIIQGRMKSKFPPQLLGVRSTVGECFDLVYGLAPDAVGMSYAKEGTSPTFADKGECYAEYEGHGTDVQPGFVACVMGGGKMNGPGNVPPSPVTTTTTTTSTTTRTTTTTTTTTQTTTTTATTTTTTTSTTTETQTTTTTLTTTTTTTTQTSTTALTTHTAVTTAVEQTSTLTEKGPASSNLPLIIGASAGGVVLVAALAGGAVAATGSGMGPVMEGAKFEDETGGEVDPEAQQEEGGDEYGEVHEEGYDDTYDEEGGWEAEEGGY